MTLARRQARSLPAPLLALLLLVLPVLAPLGAAQGDQPAQTPQEFRNAQENGFGRLDLPPYLETSGDPVALEVGITLHDLAALERAANLLVAFKRESRDVAISEPTVTAGGRTLVPVREAIVEGGLQKQQFFDPRDVLSAASDGEVRLVLGATATAKADGQWQVGVLVIAFDAGWGTLRASDGGGAELYGFSLVMETGAGGSPFVPFHGRGNAAVFLLPLFLALLVAGVGAWQLGLFAREAWTAPGIAGAADPRPAAAPPVRRALRALPSGPSPTLATTPPPTPPPPSPARAAGPVAAAPAAAPVVAPVAAPPLEQTWDVDFGYRLDAGASSEPGPAAAAVPAPAIVEAVATVTARPGPVQGPKLPAGLTPGAWRPTAIRAMPGEEASASDSSARAKPARRSSPARTTRPVRPKAAKAPPPARRPSAASSSSSPYRPSRRQASR